MGIRQCGAWEEEAEVGIEVDGMVLGSIAVVLAVGSGVDDIAIVLGSYITLTECAFILLHDVVRMVVAPVASRSDTVNVDWVKVFKHLNDPV